jgi:predicted alpha/beta superfamily hydrolase
VEILRSRKLTIHSALLQRTYGLRVQLPAGYDDPANAERLYPVVYLNDGPLNFQVAATVAQLPTSAGYLEPLILVGIGYSTETGSTESRVRDYTPVINRAATRVTGEAGGYLEFVERELVPHIERTYRADPGRRALAGHSYGGLFGAFVLLTRPRLFQHYILSSPSLWFGERAIFGLEEAYAAANNDLPATVFVAIGALEHPRNPGGSDYDMVEDVRALARRLADRRYPGLTLRAAVVEGQNHETVLPIALTNGLLWHFKARPDVPFGY